ncbi:MAG: PCRF domain-containing protein, partial [Erysipelothrix sp.]|nr:PCRF domain-containing protein [Erysipelothrix sp.]
KVEIYEATEAGSGGYTLISFIVKGDEVYRFMKFESGAHRVQIS